MARVEARNRQDPRLTGHLSRIQAYLASRRPDPDVRDRIVNAELAELIGKDGRVVVSHVLDYADELFTGKPRRSTCDKFFAELARLDAILADRGYSYYVFGGVHLGDGKSLERISFDVYTILGRHSYRSGEGGAEHTVLRVTRLEGSDLAGDRLGFTSAGHAESLVLPAKVAQELEDGLLPALDASKHTPLFEVTRKDRGTDWYRRLRVTLADVLAADFAVMSQGTTGRARISDQLVRAVDLHEVQHQLDFEEDRQRHARTGKVASRELDGPFARLLAAGASKKLVYGSLYEVSAHLAQMARDHVTARLTLAIVASYAFTDRCDYADCLASLVVLDELASATGKEHGPSLTGDVSYSPAEVARIYVELAALDRDALARAAQSTWERLFGGKLIPVTDD